MASKIILNGRVIDLYSYKEEIVNELYTVSVGFNVTSDDYHDMATLLYSESFDVKIPERDITFKGIIHNYIASFKPRKEEQTPQVIVTVSAICGETTEKAEEIAISLLIWSLQKEKGEGHQGIPSITEAKQYILTDKDIESIEQMRQNIIIGNPREVKQKLLKLQTTYQADEIMINTITHSLKDRIHSYQLIAKEALLSE